MKEGNLRQIIDALYDMEINDYFMFATMQSLHECICRLGRKNRFRVPERTEAEFNFLYAMILGVEGTLIGAATGFFALGAYYIFIFALFGMVIGAAWGLLLGAVPYIKEKIKYQKEYEKEKKEYDILMEQENARVKTELKVQKLISNESSSLIRRLTEADKLSNRLYDALGLAPEFRNIAFIGTMNEMLAPDEYIDSKGVRKLCDEMNRRLGKIHFSTRAEELCFRSEDFKNTFASVDKDLCLLDEKCANITECEMKRAYAVVKNKISPGEAPGSREIARYNRSRIEKEKTYKELLIDKNPLLQ